MTVPPTGLSREDFDRSAALDRLGGDERVLASLISHLLTSHATNRLTLEQAQEDGQPEEILAQAHTLAGAAGNLGLVTLHRAARAVVTAIRQGISPHPTIVTLGNAMEHLLENWQALINTLQPPTADCSDDALPPFSASQPEALSALCRALADRDFCSVDLYTAVRPWLQARQPAIIERLDHHMDLLNFKDAQALLSAAFTPQNGTTP
jgi:HPt (histidine-containing phosphotransfer) domain-containing protein